MGPFFRLRHARLWRRDAILARGMGSVFGGLAAILGKAVVSGGAVGRICLMPSFHRLPLSGRRRKLCQMGLGSDISLRPAVPDDNAAIAALLTAAFPDASEAHLVDKLRATGGLAIECVAVRLQDGVRDIIGHIGFSRHVAPTGWLCLAPLSVAVGCRRQGIGAALVRSGLEVARAQGAVAVSVLGDVAFYQRFGFTRVAAANLSSPYPADHTLLYPIARDTAGVSTCLVYDAAFDGV